MATLNLLKRTGKRPYRRVGRGQSSTRGKQSGRGGKGQTARAGNKRRPEMRDIIKKLPKRRGYGKNRARTVNAMKPAIVAIPLNKLDAFFDSGAVVTRAALIERGMIGRRDRAKIVAGLPGQDKSSKKFSIVGCAVSATAKSAIEKSGGSIADAASAEKKPEVSKPAKKTKKAE